MSEASKDLVIDRLKAEIEEYKTKLAQNTFDNLSQKITELEKKVQEKDSEINDLKAASSVGAGGDANEARTRLIILQSKVRQYEQKISSLEAEKQELEGKVKRMETKSADSDQLDILKRQLKQEMDANEKLRTQVNQLCMEDDRDRKIKDLEIRLANVGKGGSGASGASPAEINTLTQEVATRDRRIAEQGHIQSEPVENKHHWENVDGTYPYGDQKPPQFPGGEESPCDDTDEKYHRSQIHRHRSNEVSEGIHAG